MTWRWIALPQDRPQGAEAVVAVRELDGHPVGVLAVWPQGAKRPNGGRRIDARASICPWEAAWISLVLPPTASP
jgi:hypothetical protein